MTINKILVSAVAASFITVSAFAADSVLSYEGTVDTIAMEKVMVEDTNVSATGFLYTPKDIPAGTLANPVFKFTFSETIVGTTANIAVYEVNASDANQSSLIANYVGLSDVNGKTDSAITFRAIDSSYYASNNRSYYIGNDANKSFSNASVSITIEENDAPTLGGLLTASAVLYSGDSQSPYGQTTATMILESKYEYSAAVVNPFDARIDATQAFLDFYDQGVSNLTDDMNVSVTDDTLTYNMLPASIQFVTTTSADLNDSISVAAGAHAQFNAIDAASVLGDNNITSTYSVAGYDANATNQYNLLLTADNTNAISKSTFSTDVFLTKNGQTIAVNEGTGLNTGEWTIYGYYAQVPNVRVGGNFETYMTFTNTSDNAAAATFTILPGLTADAAVNTDASVASTTCVYVTPTDIPANSTMKFTMSKVIEESGCATSNNYGVEVSIPTEPDNVYGNAYTKNINANDFIVLPVYNTSTINQ